MGFLNRAVLREYFWIIGPVALLVGAAFWLALQFVEPAPPRSFTMSTGSPSGGYHAFGQRYAGMIGKAGVKLELKPSAGSIENLARLKDPNSGVTVTLLQGGIAQGAQQPGVVSLGRIFLEPMWLFYRSAETFDRLGQLQGLKIAVGPEGSGTRPLALAMLKLNQIDATSATLSPLTGDAAVKALEAGEIDAAFFVVAPEAPVVQGLLRNSSIKLMSFAQAEAYTRVLPYLTRIVLPEGVIDMVRNIPPRDVTMLAPATALVATESLHPALIALLVEAAKEIHGNGGLFQRIGDFPKAIDPEYEMSDDAQRIYKSGPSFLKRYLPFWLATFMERMAVLLLPIATVLVPLLKLGPALYKWSIKRRLFFWYDRLKRLEDRVRADTAGAQRGAHANESTKSRKQSVRFRCRSPSPTSSIRCARPSISCDSG